MTQRPILEDKSFDQIVSNFLHAEFCGCEHSSSKLSMRHQELVRGFLKCTKPKLTKDGKVHLTQKTAHPFDKWELEKLAEEPGLRSVENAQFTEWDYLGYCNKTG
ncbi:hypothetical protein ACJRO7_023845 [Eucalyptus globulus]|uniref:25S rRNA (uridine-N(3))-methyltransferase BMT5-like domain-containing protein n=1 Tax=Eucalyptus globulus TaxID=34317 RepID=A0ABD3K8A2_EUCGL